MRAQSQYKCRFLSPSSPQKKKNKIIWFASDNRGFCYLLLFMILFVGIFAECFFVSFCLSFFFSILAVYWLTQWRMFLTVELMPFALAPSSQWKYEQFLQRITFSFVPPLPFVCSNEIMARWHISVACHSLCSVRCTRYHRLSSTSDIHIVCIVSENVVVHHQRQFVGGSHLCCILLHTTTTLFVRFSILFFLLFFVLFSFFSSISCDIFPSAHGSRWKCSSPYLPLLAMVRHTTHTNRNHHRYRNTRYRDVGTENNPHLLCLTKIAFSQMFMVADCDFRNVTRRLLD